MTVISLMSFGDSGAAIADEQGSGLIRKANVYSKLHIIGDKMISGGSGPADFIKIAYDGVRDFLKTTDKQVTPGLIHDVMDQSLSRTKIDKKDKWLKDCFGVSLNELQAGVKYDGTKIDDTYKSRAFDSLMGDRQLMESTSAAIGLGGFVDGRFELFYADSTGSSDAKVPRHCITIGSGSDQADRVLSKYIESLPRKMRENIPVKEGLVKLVEATNAAKSSNQGVGGIPSILYMDKNQIIETDENSCVLAGELVEGLTTNQLDYQFVQDAVNSLIMGNSTFQEMEKEMRAEAKDWDKLDKYLRGYKR